ncbi:MFS transporter [Microlunatus soli]|uniref:Predicted arabinose efflux permease, MFS family n=1 Tax=Microlunatus soli TaxID=630515 RepID=A0A1H1NR23_9ACTN|nr:MFS transporter [Microlunatus soli]SDS01398.1 Predicted arabinose efflux permease, MFS family [Microlunatus soli]
MTRTPAAERSVSRRRLWPLYAAGFTTAFGAHGVAASLGSPDGVVRSLVSLGLLLALYDLAEVVLKPVFGALSDRIGARPVLLGGLLGFAAVSAVYAVVGGTPALWAVRLGQGIAASAFSPSASALVARLGGAKRRGRAYGGYGLFKSLGYTLGPLLGGLLVHLGGMRLLIGSMAVVALLVAGWCALAVPALPTPPKQRQTVVDLARQIVHPTFLIPVTALALGTAALSVGVGFLPVSGGADGLGALATGAIVSVLALSSAVVQPLAGTALDRGRLSSRIGLTGGLVVIAAGMACATQPKVIFLVAAALLIGIGVGLVTPVGFAALADRTPEAELGRTMGTAELGRELGDAGGPLLVGVLAAAYGLGSGYLVLMIITVLGAGTVFWWSRRHQEAVR